MKVDGSNEVEADRGEKASLEVDPAVEVDGADADDTPPKTKGGARSAVGADDGLDDGGSLATSGAR
jgi:hypothetical protein